MICRVFFNFILVVKITIYQKRVFNGSFVVEHLNTLSFTVYSVVIFDCSNIVGGSSMNQSSFNQNSLK